MFNINKTKNSDDHNEGQRGVATIEYVVVITFLIGLTLLIIIQMVNPAAGVSGSALPSGYNTVSQKIGQFGTLPE